MNVLVAIVLGLAMGAVFGIALEKSRVFEPGAIVSQMQLRTFLMLKIFLTAVITGLVVLAMLQGVWGVKMYPKALIWQADMSAVCCLVSASRCWCIPGTVFARWCRLSRCMVHGGRRHSQGHDVWLFGAHVARLLSERQTHLDQLAYVPFWVLALAVAALSGSGGTGGRALGVRRWAGRRWPRRSRLTSAAIGPSAELSTTTVNAPSLQRESLTANVGLSSGLAHPLRLRSSPLLPLRPCLSDSVGLVRLIARYRTVSYALCTILGIRPANLRLYAVG
jgi:hypothetical protein